MGSEYNASPPRRSLYDYFYSRFQDSLPQSYTPEGDLGMSFNNSSPASGMASTNFSGDSSSFSPPPETHITWGLKELKRRHRTITI